VTLREEGEKYCSAAAGETRLILSDTEVRKILKLRTPLALNKNNRLRVREIKMKR
jgi:hypothetical protein